MRRLTLLIVAIAVLVLPSGPVHAQREAARVSAFVRDLKNRDFEKASAAVEALAASKESRPRIIASLIDALRAGEWNRCSGDMRDSIARTLGDWQVKDAVPPLLALVRSGKSIEHECSQ